VLLAGECMFRGMGWVEGRLWQMRGHRSITGVGGAGMWRRMGMGMELGWDMWGMAGRVMVGWMQIVRAMGLETIRATSLDMETTGRTRWGRIRMGRV